VNRSDRSIQRPDHSHRIWPNLRIRTISPMFPPVLWNVHEATLSGNSRTNNIWESWKNGFSNLVGHSHPSLWVLIGSLQEYESMANTAILQATRGQPPKKRVKRSTFSVQSCLLQLCEERRAGLKFRGSTVLTGPHYSLVDSS